MGRGRPKEFNDEQVWELRRMYKAGISLYSIAFVLSMKERVVYNAIMGLKAYQKTDENHIHYVPPCKRIKPSQMIRLRFRDSNEWFIREFIDKFYDLSPDRPVQVPLFDYPRVIPVIMQQYWESKKKFEYELWGRRSTNFEAEFKSSYRHEIDEMEIVNKLTGESANV